MKSSHQIQALVEYAEAKIAEGKPITVQVMKDDRTLAQNAMFYGLYRDWARLKGDETIDEIKNFCKLHYGIPILRGSDPKFCERYDEKVKPLPYEAKLAMMDFFDVTSLFNVEHGSEYITAILGGAARQGIFIPPPDYIDYRNQ